jgi:hypothetical protein
MTTTTSTKDKHPTGDVLTATHAAGAPTANVQRVINAIKANPQIFNARSGMGAGQLGQLTRQLRNELDEIARGYRNFKDEGPGGQGRVSVGENIRFVKLEGARAIVVIADVPAAAQGDDNSPKNRYTVKSTQKNDKGQYVELVKGFRSVDDHIHVDNHAAFYDQHRQPKA